MKLIKYFLTFLIVSLLSVGVFAKPKIYLPAIEGETDVTLKLIEVVSQNSTEGNGHTLVKLNFYRQYLAGKVTDSNRHLNFSVTIKIPDPFTSTISPQDLIQSNVQKKRQELLSNYIKYCFYGPQFSTILIGGSSTDLAEKDPRKIDFYYQQNTYRRIDDLVDLVSNYAKKIMVLEEISVSNNSSNRHDEFREMQQKRLRLETVSKNMAEDRDAYIAAQQKLGENSPQALYFQDLLGKSEKEIKEIRSALDAYKSRLESPKDNPKAQDQLIEQVNRFVSENKL